MKAYHKVDVFIRKGNVNKRFSARWMVDWACVVEAISFINNLHGKWGVNNTKQTAFSIVRDRDAKCSDYVKWQWSVFQGREISDSEVNIVSAQHRLITLQFSGFKTQT